jgi:hypothetical protein
MTFNLWCGRRVKTGEILTLKDGRKVSVVEGVGKDWSPRNTAYFKNVYYITVRYV